ncbi:MAG: AI-2E family transporter [Chitinophagales bacterium]|nr:AI-2E family transporter [Hyphomicrobiales bacterium]
MHGATERVLLALFANGQPMNDDVERPGLGAGILRQTGAAVSIGRDTAIKGIFVLLIFYTLYFAAPVLIPIAAAILLSLLLYPLVERLERLRIPRGAGAAIVVLAALGFIVMGLAQLAGPAQEWVTKLPASFTKIEQKLRIVKKPIQDIQKATEQIESATEFSNRPRRQRVEIARPGMIEDIFSGTQRVVASIGVTLILLFFLLSSGDLFMRKLAAVFPALNNNGQTAGMIGAIRRDISFYLTAATCINVGLGLMTGIAAFYLGVPNAALWGSIVALLAFVPYVGSVISIVILSLAGMVEFDSLGRALILPGLFLTASIFVQSVIVPQVMGRRLVLNPVAIFLAITVWGWMWGIIGALMAVPLLASVKIFCERVPSLRPVAEFLSR